MRSSSYDTYYSSSTRNSNYSSPLHSLDVSLTPFSGSDRAEFRDRYQNKVKDSLDYFSSISCFLFSMHGLKKIMLMK
jgi:hypothetical protein